MSIFGFYSLPVIVCLSCFTKPEAKAWISNPNVVCICNYLSGTLPPPNYSRSFLKVNGEISPDVATVAVVGPGGSKIFKRKDFLSPYENINLPYDNDGMPTVDPTGEYFFIVTDGYGHFSVLSDTLKRCLGKIEIFIGEPVLAERLVAVSWKPPKALYGSEPETLFYEVRVYQFTQAPMDGAFRIWILKLVSDTKVNIPPLSSLSIKRKPDASISGWIYSVWVIAEDEDGNRRSYSSKAFKVK